MDQICVVHGDLEVVMGLSRGSDVELERFDRLRSAMHPCSAPATQVFCETWLLDCIRVVTLY